MVRKGKTKGFFYLDHRTVDGKYNVITDVYATPGNINDVDPYIDRLETQIEKFNFDTKYVVFDTGHSTNQICKKLSEKSYKAVLGFRLGPHVKGKFTKYRFQYVSNPDNCTNCKYRDKCLTSDKASFRTVRRHVWEDYKEEVFKFTKTGKGKNIYNRRKEKIERSFTDSKNLHGLCYARSRGIKKVSEQCLLTAAVQNMKKITRVLSHKLKWIILPSTFKSAGFLNNPRWCILNAINIRKGYC